jgi:hypothetical protein
MIQQTRGHQLPDGFAVRKLTPPVAASQDSSGSMTRSDAVSYRSSELSDS